jgi:anti-sigma factor RsiW
MTCRHCRRLLSPYLDNALTAGERGEVAAHLAQCSACAELLHQLESNRQLVQGLPPAEVTKNMSLLLQSRIQTLESRVWSSQSAIHNSQSAVRPWWRGWGMISVGTLAAGVTSVFLFFSNAPAPPQVPAEEVVGSMEELIAVLDLDDTVRAISQETEEEAIPRWGEDLYRWPSGRWRDLPAQR